MAAANDLEEISNYLYLHHPSFALHTIQRLYDAVKSLKSHPRLGRSACAQDENVSAVLCRHMQNWPVERGKYKSFAHCEA